MHMCDTEGLRQSEHKQVVVCLQPAHNGGSLHLAHSKGNLTSDEQQRQHCSLSEHTKKGGGLTSAEIKMLVHAHPNTKALIVLHKAH